MALVIGSRLDAKWHPTLMLVMFSGVVLALVGVGSAVTILFLDFFIF